MGELIVGIQMFGKTKDDRDEKSVKLRPEIPVPVTPDGTLLRRMKP